HAYADGRVDPDRKALIDAWLAQHPDEAERIETYRRFGDDLRSLYDPVLDEPVPSRLTRSAGPRRRWVSAAMAAMWLAIGIAVGAAVGWQLHEWRTPPPVAIDSPAVMARRAAMAHATY